MISTNIKALALLLFTEGTFGRVYDNYNTIYNEYTTYNSRYGEKYYEEDSLDEDERALAVGI